jgi:hypothetical protein
MQNIIVYGSHTKGENTYRKNRERQETQNLKVFDVTTVEELI